MKMKTAEETIHFLIIWPHCYDAQIWYGA